MTTFDKTIITNGQVAGYPCSGPITVLFGVSDGLHPNGHAGTDIAPPKGAPVYAPADADVADVFSIAVKGTAWDYFKSIFGNAVILDHGDCYTLYAHLDSTTVREGQRIKQGDLIGYVGATGYAFDGNTGLQGTDGAAHLHWGMAAKDNRYFAFPPQTGPVGVLLNPLDYIARRDEQPPQATPPVQSEGWSATVTETEEGLTINVRKPQ